MKLFVDLDKVKSKEKSYLTHNFHPYPAKYIPQIPGSILDRYTLEKNAVVLDPFAGSGTTLIESIIRGYDAIGIDSNPISALISKVKSTPLNDIERSLISIFMDDLSSEIDKGVFEVELPDFKNRDHWFQRNMLMELLLIKNLIQTVENSNARDFLMCALSAVTVKCSNQENDTRWAAKQKNLSDGFAFKEFFKKLTAMLTRINELDILAKGSAKVFNGDSTNMYFLEDKCVDIVITSPPYLNSYDYYLYHKLRMFILGFDHLEAQNLEIGSRNKHSDKNLGAESYFESMKAVAEELYRVLKPTGKSVIVVGDAIVNKKLIDMSEEYIKFFEEVGFKIAEAYAFDQRKYTTTFIKKSTNVSKKTHVLVFEK